MIKILVIDENPDDLAFLKTGISEAFPGSAFLTASNGQTGMERTRAEDPDVILLDIATPGMDGFEVCRRLKEDDRFRDIPVIFLTPPETGRESRRLALVAGADGFLSKPVDDVELAAQIRTMVKMKAANRFSRTVTDRPTALVDERTVELKEGAAERKPEKAALNEQKEFIEALLDHIGEAVVSCDAQGRLVRFNRAARELHGLPEEPIPPGQWAEHYDLYEADGKTPLRREDIPLFRALQGETVRNVEMMVVPKGGGARSLIAGGRPIRDATGNITGAVASMHDITGRKRAMAELLRTNRALRVISECNQLLVHATDEQALLDGVCRVLVEHGDYRMAWIGFAERNEAKSVRPVAQAGFEDGYLDTVSITWADTERGRGPTGTAIRTGKPVVARNIPADPAYGPWRAAAIRRGYVSSVALPLVYGDRDCHGALMAYSAKPDAFDATEVALLNELAGDLAFGLSVLRMRDEHRRADQAVRQERDFSNAALDALPCVFYCCDESLKLRRWNRNFERATGYSGEEIARMSPLDFLAGEEKTLPAERIRRVFDKGELEFEADFVAKDGTRTPYHFTGMTTLIDGRRHLLGVGFDITARKKAEEDLRLSQKRFFDAFHASPAGMSITRIADGSFIEVNEAFLRMFELSREEVVGHTSIELNMLAPEERAVLIKRQLESGGLRNHDLQARTRSGQIRHLLFSSNPIQLAGQVCHITTLIDVTDRKAVETALKVSEERYRALVENAPDAIFIVGTDGRFREVNSRACEMFGYTSDEFVGLPIEAVVAEHETARQEEALRRVLAGERVVQERQFRRKDGTLFPGEIVAGETGGGLLLAIVRDISARKETEEELRKFFLLAESSSEFIGMCDLDMKPFYGNPAAIRMVGLPDMAAACRVKVQDYFFPEDQPFITEEFFPRVLREGHGDVEIRLRHFGTGEPIWMFYSLFSVRDAGGKPVGWATVSRDITARKRAEEEILRYKDHLEELVEERTGELREANRHLQELDRLKSLFIASMSHELRTPLNSIIGFTGIILMGMSGEISDVQRKQLGMVKKSADHLLGLINDVIDVSKIETGKADLSIEAFDLSDLVLEVKESFSVAASTKGLNLEGEAERVGKVTSDRRRVKQILVNLIGNAVKFTETGTVTIRVSKTNKGVSIKVSDTGIGIEPEDMEMLFAAFSRVHIHGRPLVEGTGLGLYLSRRIATLLGGEITAESEPGKGSTFALSLPWEYPEGKN